MAKAADQTAVVQGQTPEGAVASETTVAPHEVPGAIADVQAQGKTPVVTSTDAAVARRAKLVAEENALGIMRFQSPRLRINLELHLRLQSPRQRVLDLQPRRLLSKPATVTSFTIAGEEVPVVVAAEPVGNKVASIRSTMMAVSRRRAPSPVDMFKESGKRPRRLTAAPTPRLARKVSEMTPDETKSALLTDDLTQIPNSRAYESADKKPTQVMVDANSLKYINDTGGHEAGDHLIKSIAQVLHEESGGSAYRKGGDEFGCAGRSPGARGRHHGASQGTTGKAAVELKSPDGAQAHR